MSRSGRDRGPVTGAEESAYPDSFRVGPARPPCAICGHGGSGHREQRHLTHGISVWLCDAHRSDAFMKRRSGREFAERLSAVWAASGVLTVRRQDALEGHVRRVQMATAERHQPGSYSWPMLRREAERRFAAGEPPAQVIAELRQTYRDGPAMVPSLRTMRRWFTQARWLASASNNRRRQSRPPATPVRSHADWRPLIDLILRGVAYPATAYPRHSPRGP
jgi:hypothetical protein